MLPLRIPPETTLVQTGMDIFHEGERGRQPGFVRFDGERPGCAFPTTRGTTCSRLAAASPQIHAWDFLWERALDGGASVRVMRRGASTQPKTRPIKWTSASPLTPCPTV